MQQKYVGSVVEVFAAVVSNCERLVMVVGEKPPAMSISWAPPVGPRDSGFGICYADLLPDDPGFDELPVRFLCLNCLVEDSDEQLGRGLDLARQWGQADWDPEIEEWFRPDDAFDWRRESD